MTAIGFLPIDKKGYRGIRGQFLTFVLPAPAGCSLNCPFCLIKQREEASGGSLHPDDLARFILEAAESGAICALSIQGYEPLLPESLPYTKSVLSTGQKIGIPTSLVTNGLGLVNAIDVLAGLKPAKIAISLDSASADIHDRLRGKAGAFDETVEAIRQAKFHLPSEIDVIVSSVLIPYKATNLLNMPPFLQSLGIRKWIINPLIKIRGKRSEYYNISNKKNIFGDILLLKRNSDFFGVDLTIDDEFNHLEFSSVREIEPLLHQVYVRTLPPGLKIFRLGPEGQCSAGSNILKELASAAPRWQPNQMHAANFLTSL